MRPSVYISDHPHSRIVGNAFAEGCEGRVLPPLKLLDGPAAVYGILRGCDGIVRECEWVGRDYYHIDHGYFRRGHYDGYYRVSRNGLQCKPNGEGSDGERWKSLDLEIEPWRKAGRDIVVAPMSKAVGTFLGINTWRWTEAVVKEIALHTDRPVVIKPKGEGDLDKALADAWCLVTHASNAAVDALRMGIPVVVLGASAVAQCGWTLQNIEEPHWWPDREKLFSVLADNQWTLEEMRDGTCWRTFDATGS